MAGNTALRQDGGAADGASTAALPALWLGRVMLTGFRSYAGAEIETDARPVVLTGPNGAGKTNLLEAISFLAPGRGLRRARLAEVERQVPPGSPERAPWAVAAKVVTLQETREIGTGRDPTLDTTETNGRERRLVRIDGASARSQQELGEILGMVWLTPQMDGLFREGATGRRRFLDRLVYGFDPAHAGRVGAYEQNLRERARLLKTGRADPAWLDALEEGMGQNAVAIAAARRDLVARLGQACAAAVGTFPVAGLTLSGEVEDWLAEEAALAVEDRLRGRLSACRGGDAETGGAAVGPHRSDLLVRHLGRDQAAELCSTGEQKALLISIVLAHARLIGLHRGAAPLLLLDEVAAHLDAMRRRALYDEILALGVQAWMTGTDAETFAPLGEAAQNYRVLDSTLRPAA